ncbi:FecR family protein [Paracoccus shanxieyensis]|uniref:DUF4880 domain-containing protein n=1 Tax=Paracoccus shanxieyensis TaxID=2675752 RepID=A0A6L6J2S8_9RHOB|nr:FecR domain-containing protein [Paracoccus shanxieyensis]MTH65692.1 DUF4880 domain-containing protein [Paracoccus shanxieyensis]MTH88733.1 DUF4880 domain-containing protein [Paracoccus shanxieyensis]
MSADRGSGAPLLDQAIDLLIRLQSEPSPEITLSLIRSWRQRSPQHEAAWCRAAKLHGLSGEVLAPKDTAGMPRRTLLIGGLALAGLGLSLGPGLVTVARADYQTGLAEIREVTLADGSRVTLGPKTALAAPAPRQAALLQGMVFLDIKAAPQPFRLRADDCAFELSQGQFDLSMQAREIDLSVAGGQVSAQNRILAAGDWLRLDTQGRTLQAGTRPPTEIASWRDAFLIAQSEPLASVSARIARWLPGRLVIASPSLAGRRISGIYDLRDPLAALRAAVQPTGGQVRQVTPLLTIISAL